MAENRTHNVISGTAGPGSDRSKVLHLEVTRDNDTLKISAFERLNNEEITIHDYEKVHAPMAKINARSNHLVKTLNEANRRGRMSREVLSRLSEIGQIFHDELFSHAVKEKLKNTNAEYIRLRLDDGLIHIPWELLNDGDRFLCQRFCMGRLVKTGQKIPEIRYRKLDAPLTMMVLADPEKNLKGAYQEGTTLRDYMDQNINLVSTTLHAGAITADAVKEKIRNFDIVHFAGHVEYIRQKQKEGGWRLSNSLLKTEDIIKMAGTANMPSLVFSNGCQSARTKEWRLANDFQDEICTLANAFLIGGIRHYIGTFLEIPDRPSINFALYFYQSLLAGMPVGKAVRDARKAIINEFGEETIVWASYLLYGDPATGYFNRSAVKEPLTQKWTDVNPGTDIRSSEEEKIDFSQNRHIGNSKKQRFILTSVAASLLLLVLLFAFFNLNHGLHDRDNIDTNMDQGINKKDPAGLSPGKNNATGRNRYLIQADALFMQGELENAKRLYQKAAGIKELSDSEMAEAMIMLGRIASLENKPDQALDLYSRASDLAPEKEEAHISRAILLERAGEFGRALTAIKKAQSLAPHDRGINALGIELSTKIALTQNKAKQERIDRLIKDLLHSPKNTIPADEKKKSDGPTIWVMEFKSSGFGSIEGEEKLVATGILSRLAENSGFRFVERSTLDKLLQELKIGTSTLTEKGVILSVGRIIGAQFIISGRIVHAEGTTMVSCRIIETETTQVRAALSETFTSPVSPDKISATLSPLLQTKIAAHGSVK
jgi:CHAT domain-containing protein/TolB-like protein